MHVTFKEKHTISVFFSIITTLLRNIILHIKIIYYTNQVLRYFIIQARKYNKFQLSIIYEPNYYYYYLFLLR